MKNTDLSKKFNFFTFYSQPSNPKPLNQAKNKAILSFISRLEPTCRALKENLSRKIVREKERGKNLKEGFFYRF